MRPKFRVGCSRVMVKWRPGCDGPRPLRHDGPRRRRRKATTEAAGRATLASVTGGRLTIRRRPSPGALHAPADGASGRC
jgi:hypothetical protein